MVKIDVVGHKRSWSRNIVSSQLVLHIGYRYLVIPEQRHRKLNLVDEINLQLVTPAFDCCRPAEVRPGRWGCKDHRELRSTFWRVVIKHGRVRFVNKEANVGRKRRRNKYDTDSIFVADDESWYWFDDMGVAKEVGNERSKERLEGGRKLEIGKVAKAKVVSETLGCLGALEVFGTLVLQLVPHTLNSYLRGALASPHQSPRQRRQITVM